MKNKDKKLIILKDPVLVEKDDTETEDSSAAVKVKDASSNPVIIIEKHTQER
jgi:hypothetical protein